MPTLNIEGRQVTVDDSFMRLSPDQQNATVDEIARSWATPQGSTAGGIAKQLATGAVTGTLGIPGDAMATADALGDWLNRKYAEAGFNVKPPRAGRVAPTGQEIQGGIERATGTSLQPQGTAEEYARTAGEFAPALIGGPETLLAKLASRVAVPAALSETAGQITKGTAAEPYARLGGALIGGGGAAGIANRAEKVAVPMVDEIKAAARAGYQHPEVAAVEIKPQAVSNLSAQIQNDLTRGPGTGFRPITTPKTFSIVDELNVPKGIQSVKIADIDSARQALGNLAREVDAVGRPTAESAAASRAMKGIDVFLGNLKQPDLLAGDAVRAVPILESARKNWGAAMRAEDIGVRLTRAERQAAKAGSGSNIDNAIRQKVSAVLDVPQRSVGYSAAEKAQAEKVVRGTPTGNLLRKVGKLGFNDGLTLMAHAAAAIPSGGASIPIGVAGTIARKVSEGMTAANARKLDEMLRSRSPLAQQMAAASPPAPRLTKQQIALLQAILATQSLRSGNLPIPQPQPPIMNPRY